MKKQSKQPRIEVFHVMQPKATIIPGWSRLAPWYFRIKAANNQIIAQSEGYTRKSNALKTAKLIAGNRMKVVVL